jgi:hypothetical protein
MATLKKLTRVGADVRQIARLLQAKAPEGHMLAYITPEEAELLKSQGGSGKEHADTGIPSFEDESMSFESNYPTGDVTYQPVEAPTQVEARDLPSYESVSTSVPTDRFSGAYQGTPVQTPSFAGQQRIEAPYIPQNMTFGGDVAVPGGYMPTAMTMGGADSATQQIETPTTKTMAERYSDLANSLGVKEETLSRLGLAGGLAALGAYQSNKAKKEGQAGKEEMKALAAPYQQQGQQLSSAAQRGELTPVGQQQLQTVQAQLSQQASSRGGVGAQQSAAQVEAFRNQLLQQQYDYGLKLSGIGDQIALGAIKTGMQADQYVNNLTSSYYNNIARTMYGQPPESVAQKQTTTGAT